jgi:hypothetical protein
MHDLLVAHVHPHNQLHLHCPTHQRFHVSFYHDDLPAKSFTVIPAAALASAPSDDRNIDPHTQRMSYDASAEAGPSTTRTPAAPRPRSDYGSIQDDDAEAGADAFSQSASPGNARDHQLERSEKPRKRSQVRHACWTCRTDKVKVSPGR